MNRTYLQRMADDTPTVFWNDSCVVEELRGALDNRATGATSNPPLVLRAIQRDQSKWDAELKHILTSEDDLSDREAAWRLIEGVIKEAASLLRPLYERSGGEEGLLSVQVDPTKYKDADFMINHALHLNSIAPNLSIKIPTTRAGLAAVEELTSRGVNTTATISFSVPQVLQIAQAYDRGLRRIKPGARKPHSFAVIMVGRLDDHLKDEVREKNIPINANTVERAGVAVVKRAYKLFVERGFASKILIGGMRGLYHITEFVGAGIILTIPPSFQERILRENPPLEDAIWRPVDSEIIRELEEKFPDFRRAYDEDGMGLEEFEAFGPNVKTQNQFIGAYLDLVKYVGEFRRREL
ncbi:MAG: transaldolase family protein [bacterium]